MLDVRGPDYVSLPQKIIVFSVGYPPKPPGRLEDFNAGTLSCFYNGVGARGGS